MLVWEQQEDDQSEASLCSESDGRLLLYKSMLTQLVQPPADASSSNDSFVCASAIAPFVVGTRAWTDAAYMVLETEQAAVPELLVRLRLRKLQTDLYLNMAWLARPVLGFIYPIVILFTILTNSIFLIVLLERRMRNATNLILAAMVTCETLTVAFAEPLNLYFYTLGNYRNPIPPALCQVNRLFQDVLPVTFHMASLWLTVALAAHRYLFMRSALLSRGHQSFRSTVIVVVAIIVCAALPQSVMLMESSCVSVPSTYNAVDIVNEEEKARAQATFSRMNTTMLNNSYSWLGVVTQLEAIDGIPGFILVKPCWVIRTNVIEYLMMSYYSFRAIMVHAIPCLMLVVLNVCLMVTVRSAENRRKSLLNQNQNNHRVGSTVALDNAGQVSPGQNARAQTRLRRRATAETNTTLMLVIVVLVFLAVEGPSAVVIVLYTMTSMGIIDQQMRPPPEVIFICNSAVIFSYPFTFFIYCTMSYQFRVTFLRKLSQLVPFLAPLLEHLNPNGFQRNGPNNGNGTTMNEQDLPLTSADVSRVITGATLAVTSSTTTTTGVSNIGRAHSMSDASPRVSRHSSLGVYAHIQTHGGHSPRNGSRLRRSPLLSPPSNSLNSSSQRPSPQLEHEPVSMRRLENHSFRY